MGYCHGLLQLFYYFLWPDRLSADCELVLISQTVALSPPLLSYIKYFLLTNIIEFPIYFWGSRGLKLGSRILQVFFLNLATHPAVVYVFSKLFAGQSYGRYVLASETFAVIVEGVILTGVYKYSIKKGVLLSLAANLLSWTIGAYLFI